MRKTVIIVHCIMLFFAACTDASGGIEIKNAWARPGDAGGNSAIYFEIKNDGADDQLLTATSGIAQRTELHRSSVDAEGKAHMEHQQSVEIPGRETVFFTPGGLHVMLLTLEQPLSEGDTFDVTLIFEVFGKVTINVPVQNP